jgi:DNA polymerase III alpha subunit
MKIDKFGQTVLDVDDLVDHFMSNPDSTILPAFTSTQVIFNSDLELEYVPVLEEYIEPDMTVEEFDRQNQGQWNMPREYTELDIAKWLLDRCNTDAERQRVGEELLLYLDRDMFPLLQYLKYLVDTMRKYNIVWGVGRGSSVSSYVLYLIGIHKIDSIYYGLDIQEFLR